RPERRELGAAQRRLARSCAGRAGAQTATPDLAAGGPDTRRGARGDRGARGHPEPPRRRGRRRNRARPARRAAAWRGVVNGEGCLACDALAGRVDVPGGTITATEHWQAEHCLGPFGVGAVVVKTKEHVGDLWHLPDAAAAELGPLLRCISGAIVDGLG